jgi:hypothetical protein
MSDLLSAASLLLAIIAVLYGMWYPEIVRSLATGISEHAGERRKPRYQVAAVRKSRALPLMIATILLAAVFLPDATRIVVHGAAMFKAQGVIAVLGYSAVATAFVLVEIVAIGFAVSSTRGWLRFGDLLRKLS